MELLSDDEVLLVLRYVPVRSLLTCRLVCKRLKDLVEHPDAWRDRAIGDDWTNWREKFPCLCPVLRVAPCLRSLEDMFLSDERKEDSCRPAAFVWTRCAATRLKLEVMSQADVAPSAAAITKQDGLGRLRELRLSFSGVTDSAVVLAAALSVPRLEKLDLSGQPSLHTNTPPSPAIERVVSACTRSAMEPSLREFTSRLVVELESFVNGILTRHAATLEKVSLSSGMIRQCPTSLSISSTAPLLAALPRLRTLSVCSIPGLEAVAACESLTDLHLIVSNTRRQRRGAKGVATLLRDIKCLRRLGLFYMPHTAPTDAGMALGVELIQALASSTRPQLKEMNIAVSDLGSVTYGPHVQALIGALPSLPALETLTVHVGAEPDELVLALTPTTAPALKELSLDMDRDICVHAWYHGDVFKTIMARHPMLHFNIPYGSCCRKDSCAACSQSCHDTLRRWNGCVNIYCHDPDDTKCSLDHKGINVMHWVHNLE